MSNCQYCGGMRFEGMGHYCPQRPRCDCHQCTQARLPQPPLIFFDPTKGVLPQMTIDAAVATERERCALIAQDHATFLKQDLKSMFGQVAEACAMHAEKIAAKIRGGE